MTHNLAETNVHPACRQWAAFATCCHCYFCHLSSHHICGPIMQVGGDEKFSKVVKYLQDNLKTEQVVSAITQWCLAGVA